MSERQFEPGEPGWNDRAPQHRGGTPKTDERRQAGPPATLDQNIDNPIDEIHHTGEGPGAQAHPILVSYYAMSAAVAAIIATALSMRGAP